MLEDAALVERRRRWLVEVLGDRHRIVTNEAADELGVSVDTVRRDLRALDADGLVRRVHGGAVSRSTLPTSFAGRRASADDARTRLAAAVVARLRPHAVVGLDAGTVTGSTVASRLMAGTATGNTTTTVDFQLYQDAGRTTIWGNTQGTNTVAGTGTGAAQSITVYGQVPAQATPKPDTYQTTVTATVYF